MSFINENLAISNDQEMEVNKPKLFLVWQRKA